jgi:hypothetical protein
MIPDWTPLESGLDGTSILLRAGVVLYDGIETLPLGPALWAVPLSTLWLT